MHVEQHKGNNGSLHYLYHILHCEKPYLFSHNEIHGTGLETIFIILVIQYILEIRQYKPKKHNILKHTDLESNYTTTKDK